MAATAKHFLGYSDPKYGWDRGETDMSEQAMYEYHVTQGWTSLTKREKFFINSSPNI